MDGDSNLGLRPPGARDYVLELGVLGIGNTELCLIQSWLCIEY